MCLSCATSISMRSSPLTIHELSKRNDMMRYIPFRRSDIAELVTFDGDGLPHASSIPCVLASRREHRLLRLFVPVTPVRASGTFVPREARAVDSKGGVLLSKDRRSLRLPRRVRHSLWAFQSRL